MAKKKKLARVKSLLETSKDSPDVRDLDFFIVPLGMKAKKPEDGKPKKKKNLLKQGGRNIGGGAARRHELLKKVMEEI